MPTAELSVAQSVLQALSRAAARSGRESVVVLEEDLAAADAASGSRTRTHKAIQELEAAGRLRQVRRGLYVIASLTGVIDVTLLSLIDIVTPRPYLVTAGRALALAGLTDQFFRETVVLVPSKRSDLAWRGERARYARVPASRIWGGPHARGRDSQRLWVAGRSRAILDSIAHPEWGVTLAQVTQALDAAVSDNRAFSADLAKTALRYGNASAARRLGFLLSRLYPHEPEVAAPLLPLRGDSNAMTPLLIGGSDDGPTDPIWRVRENIEFQRLADHRTGG
jgi:predicted transcriptional regulator of viral defense system